MTPLAAAAVALLVWAVGLIRPVRARALLYSLPVPMSLVLVGGRVHVDGTQVIGVLLLVAFFAVTALLHLRLGWPVLLADVTAAAGYVAVAWALPAPLPLVPCVIIVVGLWLAGLLVPWPSPATPAAPRPSRPRAALKLAAVCATTFAVAGLAGLLAGLVVTFPFSGVLVAVEVRRDLAAFTRHFARTAIALVAFVCGFAAGQDHGVGAGLALGWLAYGGCAVVLHRSRDRMSPAHPSLAAGLHQR
ncbi:hypothetical protein [Krasilnikovia sp. M28-CT-15]|uniref:hypothetical protein n=1 Tax=Krasilnikovia sp. M28-CT-15 TaxID=3373540 RepID=UPI00387765CC